MPKDWQPAPQVTRGAFPELESAEIIPVEPDPDHAGVRERRCLSSAPGSVRGAFLLCSRYPGMLEEFEMKLIVNGEPHEHRGNGSVSGLLDELGAQKAHTALMINGEVVPSDNWSSTILHENDEIEMLVFVGGG